MSGAGRVQVVTRAGCHLCDEAIAVVRRVAPDVQLLDVDADPALLRRFSDQVPVVLVDGRVHEVFRVDEARLRRALEPPRGRWWRRA